MIHVDGFGKVYGDIRAVDEISFRVQPGQVLGLVGPNGAGKTTTLRALTGIIPASRGRLEICGFDVQQAPLEAKRRAAYVPDDPQLFHELTVQQHLEFTAATYGVEDGSPRMESLLAQFELTPKRHAAASGLSRGMRQKLAICCAYIHDPPALLMDEPMTGLDPRGIRTLKESIAASAAAGAAIIISSHLLAVIEQICTHVVILDHGRQKFWGSVEQLHEQFRGEERSLEEIFFAAVSANDSADTLATA